MIFVPRMLIRPGMKLASDLHLPAGDAALLKRGTELTLELVCRLQQYDGIDGVYISNRTDDDNPYIKPTLDKELRDRTLVNLQGVFQAAINNSGSAGLTHISALSETISQIIVSVKSAKDILVNINDLKDYDDYTYHHCLSVAVLAIAIGVTMGLDDKQLAGLGMSAILHDMGKILIPIEILNKPSRLTNEEFEVIKQHPNLGIQYLSRHNLIDADIYSGVAMHHERVDGAGYPNGRTENDIPLFAKIISVADVYDALTSQRPYRTPMQPFEAIEYLMAGCSSAFDWDVLSAFVAKIEMYPKGSFVRLSNDKYYQVLDATKNLRPIVREVIPPYEVVDLNAMESLNLVVAEAFTLLPDNILTVPEN